MFHFICVLSCFSWFWLFVAPWTEDPGKLWFMGSQRAIWTITCQVPLSMAFSRQVYWSGLPCPPSEDLSDSEIKLTPLMPLALTVDSVPLAPPGKPQVLFHSPMSLNILKENSRLSQDGVGIGWGDHFLPYKFIEITIECRANFTKQLLIAS